MWARQRFALDLDPDSFAANLSNDEAEKQLRQRVREAYRHREWAYPVEWIIERTVAGPQADNAYAVDALAQWANLKFNLGWSVDTIRGKTVKEVADQLFDLSRAYLSDGRLDEEISREASQGRDLAEWGRARFGPAFDQSIFDSAADKKDVLKMFGHDLVRRELTALERYVLLQIYDQSWKEHMHAMDLLKEAIGLRGFAEQDPKIAYKREGFKMFQEMMESIQEKVTSTIFKVRLSDDTMARSRLNPSQARHADSTNQGFTSASADRNAAMQAQNVEQKIETIRREQPKVGRNDPCPCGSGKKYKQCHGKTAA
jgi:preprotein translocase subunit SecA